MNNRTLHFCWFGGAAKPEIVLKCLESWRKFCPEYEIIEWSEDNFDIECCPYVKQAYENKKWAFVSDYCRFWVLYNYGGVYLDTDVELLKSIDDLPDTFVGFENESVCNSGLIRGANAGDEVCKSMLESYNNDTFIKDNGKLNLSTVCERETSILKSYGLIANGKKQIVNGTTVFPKDYFCPYDYETKKLFVTENTYSIHHYMASWTDGKLSVKGKIYKIIKRLFGKKFAERCRNAFKNS